MSFMKWAFPNENTCTRQMDPASHLDVPLVVSARKIKPHWTRQDPLIPAQSIDFTLGNVIPPIKHIWSLGFHILKEGAVNEFRKGGSLRTLKCRLTWKWPDAFAQYYFRDWLFWNVVWVMTHKTLGGPCLHGRQQSYSSSLLHIMYLSPKAEERPKKNNDADWSEAV